jgi:hypothetical protein
MDDSMAMVIAQVDAARVCRAEVVEVWDDGAVVELGWPDAEQLRADLLATTAGAPLQLATGDEVLVWVPAAAAGAVILGRVGRSHLATPASSEPPETLTIEATRSLTLRVGDGSITIGDDGKILIKGKDLVSHAQRMNRIKGGAVAIN